MDILYQLPFPQEICSKIFCYACKSPHTGLGIGVLKHFAYIDKEDEGINEITLPKKDHLLKNFDSTIYSFINCRRPLDIFKLGRFVHIKKLIIGGVEGECSNVTGDIQVFRFMTQLRDIHITNSTIYGNISHLNSLKHLVHINFTTTNITGDIGALSSLHSLKTLGVINMNVTGDLLDLKGMHKIFGIYITLTLIQPPFNKEFFRVQI